MQLFYFYLVFCKKKSCVGCATYAHPSFQSTTGTYNDDWERLATTWKVAVNLRWYKLCMDGLVVVDRQLAHVILWVQICVYVGRHVLVHGRLVEDESWTDHVLQWILTGRRLCDPCCGILVFGRNGGTSNHHHCFLSFCWTGIMLRTFSFRRMLCHRLICLHHIVVDESYCYVVLLMGRRFDWSMRNVTLT